MELPVIPKKLEDWKAKVLNELIKYPDIESETFDFKEESTKLYEDICAMANTNGGFLVLGIGELRDKDGQRIIGFKKIGFRKGIEENVRNEIGNYMMMIEPIPTIRISHIPDDKLEKFYTIVEVESKIFEKPYFVKTTDQCYARIQSSSRRIGRSGILNLFTNSVEQIANLNKLRSSAILLRDEFKQTLEYSRSIHPSLPMKATPIDLAFMRDAIISNETFLRNQKLLGGTSEDVIKILHILTKFNTQIEGFNNSNDTEERRSLIGQIYSPSYVLFSELSTIEPVLNKVIKICEETLKKYQ